MLGEIYADLVQGTEEWHDKKRGLASTSNFGDILAKGRGGGEAYSRRNYRTQLVLERLTGKTPSRFEKTAEMQWGTDTEALARVEFGLRYKMVFHEIGGIKHPFLEVWASTDGIDDPTGPKAVLEIKCFNSANHKEMLVKQALPAEYKAQAQGGMWLAEADLCYFVSFDPDFPPNAQLVVVVEKRDQRYIDDLAVEVSKFLEEVEEEIKLIRGYKPLDLSKTVA
jgi:hypothetical protein